mgnify:CR=1 FL=1
MSLVDIESGIELLEEWSKILNKAQLEIGRRVNIVDVAARRVDLVDKSTEPPLMPSNLSSKPIFGSGVRMGSGVGRLCEVGRLLVEAGIKHPKSYSS